jgi:hypothetical protein
MKPPEDFTSIIDRKRYSTKTATLLSGNDYWDGHNWERQGRNSFLYRTQKGAYFMVSLSQWQGEDDTLTVLSEGEAIDFFESCREDCRRVTYEEAFPGVKVEEA